MTNLSSDDCCDYYEENELNSPTDTSEDSVDVKVSPILSKNKRKCLEPRRTIPLKKRICFKARHPFRPWSPPPTPPPLLLATEKPSTSSYFRPPSPAIQPQTADEEQIRLPDDVRVPIHPIASEANSDESERMILDASCDAFPDLKSSLRRGGGGGSDHQRNYKNMTRERRIEANARERTRVHTISAAFDTLRKSIPAYSHNQKLSKLSVLRIACSYIMTLSSMIDDDGDGDYSTAECVDLVSKTIQREGKLRKKKDDND